ncbi:MAG: hypothetical protein KatS3mg025_1452 [Bacteroidia bacterium]|nr:MAG: hypothetical protein KatS3mg025_1452 [Bacteroidia bacterium]
MLRYWSRSFIGWALSIGLGGSPIGYAQRSSALEQAYEALQKRLTVNAQRYLAQAREDPDSLVRWEAALLQGILAARAGREQEALGHWYFVSRYSPTSPLGAEATYLRADLLLRKRSTWPEGLYLLRTLIESPHTPEDLRAAVENRLSYFAYREADVGFLWAYLGREGGEALFPYLAPAVSYHLRQACEWPLWRLWHAYHKQRCGTPPDSLTWESLTDSLPTETLRVALLLPLMATQEKNSPFLEFWEGFELGLQESRSPYLVWRIEVEDSERNITHLLDLLKLWESAPPHILIGEVSYTLNQLIAPFCERKGVWHAIPINPAYPRHRYAFSLTVPAFCQGAKVGSFLRDSFPKLGPGVILYDPEDPYASAFVEGVRSTYYAPTYAVRGSTAELTQRWRTLKDSVAEASWYVVGFTQEEAIGFLLHKLGRDTLPPLVIGLESWNALRYTQLKDYRRMRIWVPQSTLPDSAAWLSFSRKVSQVFSQRPSVFHAQGYDAAQWIAYLSQAYNREGLPEGFSWEGLLNRYVYPPACEKYRWQLWEYDRGEVFLRAQTP